MIAMMVPSAAPMILLYARVQRHNGQRTGRRLPFPRRISAGLPAGLAGFQPGGHLLQWALERLGWSRHDDVEYQPYLSAVFLLAAGCYQLSPLKRVPQSLPQPAGFLAEHWRKGAGRTAHGLRHGLYCVGCCWFLMLLLFVGGIMNLVWIAGWRFWYCWRNCFLRAYLWRVAQQC